MSSVSFFWSTHNIPIWLRYYYIYLLSIFNHATTLIWTSAPSIRHTYVKKKKSLSKLSIALVYSTINYKPSKLSWKNYPREHQRIGVDNTLEHVKKLMMDSDSLPSIIFGQTLWNIVLSSKIPYFDPKILVWHFEIWMLDSNSSLPIDFGRILWAIILLSKTLFFDPET